MKTIAALMIALMISIPFITADALAFDFFDDGSDEFTFDDIDEDMLSGTAGSCMEKSQRAEKQMLEPLFAFTGALEGIATMLFALCSIYNGIATVMTAISTITGTKECCWTMGCVSSEAQEQTKNVFYWGFAHHLCSYIMNGMCGGTDIFGSGEGTDMLGMDGVEDIEYGEWGQSLNPYSSIYVAMFCLNIVAMVFHMRNLETMYKVHDCCIEQACANGLPTATCDAYLDEQLCMFWQGSIIGPMLQILWNFASEFVVKYLSELGVHVSLPTCLKVALDLVSIPMTLMNVINSLDMLFNTPSDPDCSDLGFEEIGHTHNQQPPDYVGLLSEDKLVQTTFDNNVKTTHIYEIDTKSDSISMTLVTGTEIKKDSLTYTIDDSNKITFAGSSDTSLPVTNTILLQKIAYIEEIPFTFTDTNNIEWYYDPAKNTLTSGSLIGEVDELGRVTVTDGDQTKSDLNFNINDELQGAVSAGYDRTFEVEGVGSLRVDSSTGSIVTQIGEMTVTITEQDGQYVLLDEKGTSHGVVPKEVVQKIIDETTPEDVITDKEMRESLDQVMSVAIGFIAPIVSKSMCAQNWDASDLESGSSISPTFNPGSAYCKGIEGEVEWGCTVHYTYPSNTLQISFFSYGITNCKDQNIDYQILLQDSTTGNERLIANTYTLEPYGRDPLKRNSHADTTAYDGCTIIVR
ncbi:hypothetical protein H6504_03260 [Candidatus Woesearchaeota archaeon]|nr:hypothetical protein [Candidatus Woesearchaeota archaeon]